MKKLLAIVVLSLTWGGNVFGFVHVDEETCMVL